MQKFHFSTSLFFTAATPSYFFLSTPPSGHNFFFSELLRSLVQKRKADELSSAIKLKTVSKKTRKHLPSFHYQKPIDVEWKRQKLNESTILSDTNENDDPSNSPHLNSNHDNSQDSVINVDKDDSPPAGIPNSTVPHANSSAFYPFVDPLQHFFIDLRVSAGQVYDKKKEAYLHQALKNSNTWNNPIIGRNRAGSAFKVPGSFNESYNNFSAVNLISNNQNSTDVPSKFHPKSDDGAVSTNEEDVEIQIFDLEVKANQEK